ncbi:vascular endothelial growth factor receptor 1 isoform 1-T1 [Synchiropus picturatus]
MKCVFISLLCGLLGVVAREKDQKGKYSVPKLDVQDPTLVVDSKQTLVLNCRGRWRLAWAFPAGLELDQVQVEESACGRTGQHFCSRLTVARTQAQHTGLFQCRYQRWTQKSSSVYVYLTDSQQPFVDHSDMSPDVLYMTEKRPLVIPCRVTHPNLTTVLVKSYTEVFIPDQRNITWSSKQGFTIHSPTLRHINLFYCQTVINGVTRTSRMYLVHRLVSNIMEVYLNSSGPVETLKGKRLVLNCTATGELNTRVNISWDYPGKYNNRGYTSKRLLKLRAHLQFNNILTIPEVQLSDQGLYTCRVTSGENTKQQNVSVIVYERPFIKLKPKKSCVVKVHAGQKSYKISPKLQAFPTPEVVWFKDGMVAADQCSRYRVSGSSLIIRDVAEEDAGKYTMRVTIPEYGLSRNLTVNLVVNVCPQIGEKEVSLQDPGTVPRGSRKTLHCTSHGVPPPNIKWLWHPCPSKGRCVCPTSSSLWSPVEKSGPTASTHNRILSVKHRQEVLQGKKKVVGVLIVEGASVSGIYRCIASNSAGSDQLDIHFYITDIPGGFSVRQSEDAREGSHLSLTCTANKYLYSTPSWRRLNGTSHAQPSDFPLSLDFQPGKFSNSLGLLLSNLTSHDSGTYRCSTHHLLTGKKTHLDTQVVVTKLQPPVLLSNLTDCSVNVSSSVTLSCPANGVPPPTIIWYKNDNALLQGSGIVISEEDGSLHIGRVTVEDQGWYTCEAINERGSAESSAFVSVKNSPSEASYLEIPLLTCTCVAATLLWLLLTVLIRKLRQANRTKPEYLSIILDSGDGAPDEQCQRLLYDSTQWEFPRERLKLGRNLGRGAFGRVMQASAFGIDSKAGCETVAVKMLKEGATASEYSALMSELKILNYIGHHLNVVNLLGACTKPGGPLMVIVEYCCHGNLSAFLKNKREVFVQNRVACSVFDSRKVAAKIQEGNIKDPLFPEDLISYSFQVARGMEFLASRKCIHRDLAARNVLLSDNNVVKICDFGLARDIYKDPDYVRKGDARLPLKWMSPESIFDKVFTTQSDVWSYGILLWEIFSLGASPYPGLHIDEDFCHRLRAGTRMRAPEYSTPEIYSTMLACWESSPTDRPTFSTLVQTLGDLLQTSVQQGGKDYIPLGSGGPVCGGSFKQSPLALMNLGYMRSLATLQMFEEPPCEEASASEELSDSGMILPSEELRQLLWENSISRFSTNPQEITQPLLSEDDSNLQDKKQSALQSERPPPPPAFLCPSLQ